MKKLLFIVGLYLPLIANAYDLNGNYIMKKGQLTYHVNFLLKHVESKTETVQGKGVCQNKKCDFIAAAPVKSFVSKDNNRDVKMQLFTKASLNPMVVVKVSSISTFTNEMQLDLTINLAGKEKIYKQVPFVIKGDDKEFSASSTLQLNISDFEIEKPTLLGVAIDEIVPVDIDLEWSKQ